MAVVCMVNTTAYRAQLSSSPTNLSQTEERCSRSDEGSTAKGYNASFHRSLYDHFTYHGWKTLSFRADWSGLLRCRLPFLQPPSTVHWPQFPLLVRLQIDSDRNISSLVSLRFLLVVNFIFSAACCVYVIVTMATPFLAELSFRAYFAARLIMGLAEVRKSMNSQNYLLSRVSLFRALDRWLVDGFPHWKDQRWLASTLPAIRFLSFLLYRIQQIF